MGACVEPVCCIGQSSGGSVDLSGYVTDEDLAAALAGYVSSAALTSALAGYGAKGDANTWTKAQTFVAETAASVPVIVKSAAAQTAALTQWKNSADALLTYISATGRLNGAASGAGFFDPNGNGTANIGRQDVGFIMAVGEYNGAGATVVSNAWFGWSSSASDPTGGNHIPIALLKKAATKVVSAEGASSTGATFRFIPTRATQITADRNNYAPGGTSWNQLWSSDASRTVTGLSLSQVDGQRHRVINIGSNDIVLANESGLSAPANLFLTSTGADVTLSAKQGADLVYDATQSRWLVFKLN